MFLLTRDMGHSGVSYLEFRKFLSNINVLMGVEKKVTGNEGVISHSDSRTA